MRRLGQLVSVGVALAYIRLSCRGTSLPRRVVLLAHLGEPTTPPALAPRARDPPVLDAGFTCAFGHSPWWDSTAAASEPSFHFDQILN